jgi:hypothetical protein
MHVPGRRSVEVNALFPSCFLADGQYFHSLILEVLPTIDPTTCRTLIPGYDDATR